MKLFEDFEVVKFYEENLIFVTKNKYLYYIYNVQYKHWKKCSDAGNHMISVCNYDDVTREELQNAMVGIFPQKETDFMRMCHPSELWIRDMLDLLCEDYPRYLSDHSIFQFIHVFLLKSVICYKSYLEIKKVLDEALATYRDCKDVLMQLHELSLTVTGRDICKREIGIVDGHDGSSYFWIMPVRVIDYTDTNGIDNVARMKSAEISIEEDDVAQYLTPFLYPYFDDTLEANKRRIDDWCGGDEGNEAAATVEGFEWNLTYNFYTFDSVKKMLADIRDTVDALTAGRETEFTKKLKKKRGMPTYQLIYSKNMNGEELQQYNANRPTEDNTEIDLIVDFYQRFLYRMEHMLRIGAEKGYALISFMGP